ncbi:MAG: K(+)-transporting ATPase subunit C [Verrucomicrobia bacterium]|nr:K(+)-transporting ATPase subunit C [Verrucomicrobiota bacterium]
MKTFVKELYTSVAATVVLCAVVSGLYPVLIWGIGQVLFSHQANGSLVENNGQIVGSELLAQGFSGAKYFHPRPSAAGTGYDPLNSGGSNLGPTSQKLIDGIKANVAQYRQENGLSGDAVVPADAVTASGSGLDPHISLQNARIQVPRVAKERGFSEDVVRGEVSKATDNPLFGLGGEPGVNVLKVNLALDSLAPKGRLAEKKP